MAITKTALTFQASATNSAAGSTLGTAVDLTDNLGTVISAKITNGSTGPTLPCYFEVLVSNDDITYFTYCSLMSKLGNNEVTEFTITLPAEIMYAKTNFTGNTSQSVGIIALGSELTSV